jgi:hypothetical protein
MRQSFLCALAIALVAVGCTKSSPTSTASEGQPLVVPVEQKAETSTSLSGSKLLEHQDGPWVVRGTTAGDEAAHGTERMALAPPTAAMARGGSGGSGMPLGGLAGDKPADGAKPTTGAAPPAEPALAKAPAKGKAALRDEVGEGEPQGLARPTQAQAPAASPLHAGATDDNAEFTEFVKFLASWSDRGDTAGKASLLDVRGRDFIRVVDSQGRPIPTAQVQVTDEVKDKAVWAATTFGDGRAPFYPRVAAGSAKYVVEASWGGQRGRANWDGMSDLVLTLNTGKNITSPIQLDVLFAIDTTGSMQDEIDQIKSSLLSVTDKLKGLKQEFDLRYGAVLYKDLGDEYITRTYPFTSNIQAFAQALQSVNAGGGGDEPESVNQALAETVRAPWRPGAAKVVFLVGDAPPHMDYPGDVPYGQSLKAAVARGIRIHSVAASGLNPLGTLVWRQVAQFTRGKFIFIEYGSAAATAESHGVTGAFKSNNLDDIIFEQIRDELAYWGKDGPSPNVAAQ